MVVYAIRRQPLDGDLMEGPWHTVLVVTTWDRARRMLDYMADRYPEYHWCWETVRIGA